MTRLLFDILDAVIALKVKVRRLLWGNDASRLRGWHITKILLFREGAESDGADFVDLTGEITDPAWAKIYAEKFLDWDRYKIEVRHEHHGQKYRAVYRQDDEIAWPPDDGDARDHVEPPDLVLSATLHPFAGTAVDVTRRLKKYEGPHRDFGGRALWAHDLFPMDDGEDLARTFESLAIVFLDCAAGRLATRTVDVARNESIVPGGEPKKNLA